MMKQRALRLSAAVSAWLYLGFVSGTEVSPALKAPTQTRRLEDSGSYEVDLSQYSIRFGKCQYVKTFSDEMVENQDEDTVFAMKHFVVYRLCPSDQCDTCDENYGEYVAEVEDFLLSTAQQEKKMFENMCDECEEECDDDGGNCDEDGCGRECWKYENLEDNGYADASEYVECQKLDGGDDGNEIYIGPRCSSDGTRVFIGLFSDENCWSPYDDDTVESVLGLELSYHLLKNTYSDDGGDCMSCLEENDNDDDDDVDNVNEMCENIYFQSAKCEFIHGIKQGFIQMNRDDENHENQIENEFAVCNFIDSLVWESYTETGEINIFEEQDVILRETTNMQIGILSLLTFTALSLGAYAAYLHREIDLGYPNLDLSCQGGGQMA